VDLRVCSMRPKGTGYRQHELGVAGGILHYRAVGWALPTMRDFSDDRTG
jgi:hypothetical protein